MAKITKQQLLNKKIENISLFFNIPYKLLNYNGILTIVDNYQKEEMIKKFNDAGRLLSEKMIEPMMYKYATKTNNA